MITPEILLPALRQYQHNDCSGLLAGFDHDETSRIVNLLEKTIEEQLKLKEVSMDSEKSACLFEALICRVQCLSTLVAGMKAENKQCEHLGQAMAYSEETFIKAAEKYEDFAKQFEALNK